MRLERNGNRFGALLFRAFDQVAQHLLMSAMHAIEVADAHYGGAKAGRYVFEFVENLHGLQPQKQIAQGTDARSVAQRE